MSWMKENKKLVSEIVKDIRHDMSDEEILTLLASSRVAENTEKESRKMYTLGQRAADGLCSVQDIRDRRNGDAGQFCDILDAAGPFDR